MDVDQRAFSWQLPRILKAIANAHFVSVDFELSGIQSKTAFRVKSPESGQVNKQTLQQRYKEAKEAAERYQILQVGLTCVLEDTIKGVYIARPYNFYLNPILEEKLEIERIFSYQSGAVEFLLSHGFRMEAPFREGVPYLSRLEETLARQIEKSRQDKANIHDIQIRDDDIEAVNFVKKVRDDISKWRSRTTSYPEFLNIAPDGYNIDIYANRGLNNYQKRLVHQLVRAEHPDLVTISRQGFIQIQAYDKKREDAIKKSKMAGFEERVARQTGLRWLVEGMVCGDLSSIDPMTFGRTVNGKPLWVDLKEATKDFDQLRMKLASKQSVLVGHNLFMDLIYFYQCFFGKLPDSVEDFQSMIHHLFPLVIDTKYLATYHNDVANAKSGLEELDEELSKADVPVIETHPEHPKYIYATAIHEAGFDSFLTAKVLIRLSAKLEAAGQYIDVYTAAVVEKETSTDLSSPDEGGVTLGNSPPPLTCASGNKIRKRKAKKSQVHAKQKHNTSTFSHPGMFDVLGDDSSNDEHEPTPEDSAPELQDLKGRVPMELASAPMAVISNLMPSWDSDFWNVYGNKLRVNGTVEGICDLSDSLLS